jgi:hypothetical protein
VRKLLFICIGLCLCGWLTAIARGETYELSDGQSVSGEIVSFNEGGLVLRTPDDKYSDRVPWMKFSQADLKKLAENPKIAPLVEQYIELSAEERVKKTEVPLKKVDRLHRPAAHSFFGAMLSSGVGIFVLVLLYAANIYAAYEISIFRARPAAMVCGVSAIAPLIGPILFLSLPTRVDRDEEEGAAPTTAVIQPFAVPGNPAAQPSGPPARGAARPAAGRAAAAEDTSTLKLAQQEGVPSPAGLPPTQVFQRGAFTFNRRFFETKFANFFGVVRRDPDKEMVMFVKSARGQFVATRISRIAANDMHIQVDKGSASEEVMVPFSEIQEIQLKHQDA